jgi:hypothetical protein
MQQLATFKQRLEAPIAPSRIRHSACQSPALLSKFLPMQAAIHQQHRSQLPISPSALFNF